MPLARIREVSAEASATSQRPSSSAASSASVAGSSRGTPGGATSSATTPPEGITKAECGPGAPVTAQSPKVGAQPAIASERSR